MTGFQIFLLILLGIVLFFVSVLSVPVRVTLAYDDKIRLSVRYLFVRLDILPAGPKKEKKPVKKEKNQPAKKKAAPASAFCKDETVCFAVPLCLPLPWEGHSFAR